MIFFQGFLPLAFTDLSVNRKAAVLVLVCPRYFISLVPPHIWRAFPYPPPGEALDRRPSNSTQLKEVQCLEEEVVTRLICCFVPTRLVPLKWDGTTRVMIRLPYRSALAQTNLIIVQLSLL